MPSQLAPPARGAYVLRPCVSTNAPPQLLRLLSNCCQKISARHAALRPPSRFEGKLRRVAGGVHYPPKKHRRPILFRGVSGNHPTFKGGVYSGNRFPPPFSGHIGTKRCLARGEPRSQLTVCRMPIALAAACFLRWRMKHLRRPLIGHRRRRTPKKFQGTPRESHVDPVTEEESSVCAAYSA